MPKLPSGRQISLDPSPLQKVVKDAVEGLGTHRLMVLESFGDLFEHIRVLYFKSTTREDNQKILSKFSLPLPEDLEPYDSGFSLLSIKSEFDTWDEADKTAFLDFLNSDRTDKFLNSILEEIQFHQKSLLGQSTLQGLMATWWKLGVHPLQSSEDDDG